MASKKKQIGEIEDFLGFEWNEFTDTVRKPSRNLFALLESEQKEIKQAIGYKRSNFAFQSLCSPDISIAETIKAICDHLGIDIVKTPEQIQVVPRKKE